MNQKFYIVFKFMYYFYLQIIKTLGQVKFQIFII